MTKAHQQVKAAEGRALVSLAAHHGGSWHLKKTWGSNREIDERVPECDKKKSARRVYLVCGKKGASLETHTNGHANKVPSFCRIISVCSFLPQVKADQCLKAAARH